MGKFKDTCKRIKEYFPIWAWVCVALMLVSFIAWSIIVRSVAFSEFLNRTTGRAIRFILTQLTNIFPFSFVEFIIFASPILLALLIILIVRKAKQSKKSLIRFLSLILSIACVIFSGFIFGYESSYYGVSIEENVGMVRRDISPYELRTAALKLQELILEDMDDVYFLGDGSSVMPYTFKAMNDILNEDISAFCEKYPAYQNMYSRSKFLITSEPFTYTHLSGVYSFFTGEANVNNNYPDFIVISTTAHEMMHQRGVGKEEEADFAAFLICTNSKDPYIRYSGHLEIYRDVIAQLSRADQDLWREVRMAEDSRIRAELTSFSKFFDKYRENKVANVTDAVNNAYIQSQNQPLGVQSYGLVVDLAVNYILYYQK
ncbi:MAG: DUF3810 domain-containing protein [Clostridia bacterium]|nr:DUF3810 domain-containing protein [Clostridia bacterium]